MENQRLVLILGGVAALLAAVVVALLLMGGPGEEEAKTDEETAERAGLQLDVIDPETMSPDQELRCFVGGQFVGMATLSQCAERNGVASQALDVGLDSSGELTAVPFTPPPDTAPAQFWIHVVRMSPHAAGLASQQLWPPATFCTMRESRGEARLTIAFAAE